MRIVFFFRKQRSHGNFSIEKYFAVIADKLASDFEVINKTVPFESNGLLKRLFNGIYCYFNQGHINHITGDINYVSLFCKSRCTVLTIHDCAYYHDLMGLNKILYKWFWLDLPSRHVSKITVVSEHTKRDVLQIIKGLDINKIEVIPVAFNIQPNRNLKIFNDECPRILQVGTAQNKNVLNVISALIGIKCKLIVVGNLTLELLRHAESCCVEILNYENVSDVEMVSIYRQSDILCFVSHYEGFGMPIIEANSQEVCVVTSNTSSMPEVSGGSALLVNPKSVKEIAHAISLLIENESLRELMIRQGKMNFDRYSTNTVIMKFNKLYLSFKI
jgi:glycosyltransferase involved in cell wall biosynthesis